MPHEIWLIRHGETEWSLSGRHTGLTDIPLTPNGVRNAESLRRVLQADDFQAVFSSPLKRALDTCKLAGLGDVAQVETDLVEWNYGDYEGLTSAEIRQQHPGWSIWTQGVMGGETIDDVATRANRVIERVSAIAGDVALFSHGHFLRIVAACWLGLSPDHGRLLALSTGAICRLGHERNRRVITAWNLQAAGNPAARAHL